MNSDVSNGPLGTEHGPSHRFSDGRRVQRGTVTRPRSPRGVDSAGISLGPSMSPRFPRVPLSTSHDCADRGDVRLGAPRSPLPVGTLLCAPPLIRERRQLLLPEPPPPPPCIRRALRLGDPGGPSQTPKPGRRIRPVSPTGNSAEEEVKTGRIRARGPPCRPLSSCHAGDQRTAAEGENEQKPTWPEPRLRRETDVHSFPHPGP